MRTCATGALVAQGRPGVERAEIVDDVIALDSPEACEWLAEYLLAAAEILRDRADALADGIAGGAPVLPLVAGGTRR